MLVDMAQFSLDHLVYGTPNLAATVAEVNGRFGLTLSPGGQHLGFGTRNFLADLGDRRYLEVIGPDLDQPDPSGERLFGVDQLDRPKLVTWAARVDDLGATLREATDAGLEFTPIRAMEREAPDGTRLAWQLAMPLGVDQYGGVIPFLIEWGGSEHPADTVARGAHLESLTGFGPAAAAARNLLAVLGQELTVEERPTPGLRAVFRTPAGRVALD
jgi:hypothetical protein